MNKAKVYEQGNYEGIAELVTKVGENGKGREFWIVVFDDEPGSFYWRWISTEDKFIDITKENNRVNYFIDGERQKQRGTDSGQDHIRTT